MTAEDGGQQEDPSPLADGNDLSLVLRRLMSRSSSTRKTPEARKRLANDEHTRAFLEAGLSLIAQQLDAADESQSEEGDGETQRPFFEWLSRKKVIQQAVGANESLVPTDGMFRDRWPYQEDYIEDLLAYSLWDRHWSPHVTTALGARDTLTSELDFVKAIHEVAYQDLCVLLDGPAYKISLIAAATAGGDPLIRDAIAANYRMVGPLWGELYAATFKARGLRLRPGVLLEDLTDMLTALVDGLGIRLLAEDNSRLIDHERRESLLGKAALALAVACIDAGDGLSIEELVRIMGRKVE